MRLWFWRWMRRYLCWSGRHNWLTSVADTKHQCCMFCGGERYLTKVYGPTRVYPPHTQDFSPIVPGPAKDDGTGRRSAYDTTWPDVHSQRDK